MRRLRPKLTYANVTATLALIIAVGGASAFAATQLAKNSVGAKQLKKNAVITAKIKNEGVTAAKVKKGTLTGTQIDSSTLGTVPHATNADQLGGATASSFRDHCPAGTKQAAAGLCVTNSDVSEGENWSDAAHDCAARGMRLPSPSEALLLVGTTSEGYHWTDGYFFNAAAGGFYAGVSFYHSAASSPTGTIYTASASGGYPVVCVTAPSNP